MYGKAKHTGITIRSLPTENDIKSDMYAVHSVRSSPENSISNDCHLISSIGLEDESHFGEVIEMKEANSLGSAYIGSMSFIGNQLLLSYGNGRKAFKAASLASDPSAR
jgi:hypothetical protein